MSQDTSSAGSPLDHLGRLTPDQQATWQALQRLDPHLAGLFTRGIGLLDEIGEPGVAYLVAHAGRELSNGVIRSLASDVQPVADEEGNVASDERNRLVIAPVLGLPPEHPLVSAWMRVQRRLVKQVHYRPGGPDPRRVREAFEALVDMLYGRVAPYFTTQTELDGLLAIRNPAPTDLERLRRVLLRPAQRAYFFDRLAHPGWLEPLAAEGVFANPPEAVREPDGRWRWRAWPEGEFLVRVAGAESAAVGRVLMAIPAELQNAAVWAAVGRAAAQLPQPHARPLVRRVMAALNRTGVQAGEVLLKLAVHLAHLGDLEAFKVARSLLECVPTEPEPSTVPLALRSGGLPPLRLRHLETFAFPEAVDCLLPELERLDGIRTIKLLAHRLDDVIRETARLEEERHVRIRGWSATDLEDADDELDLRTHFAVALAGSAARVAVGGEEKASSVLQVLYDFPGDDVFDRIRLHVLTAAGHLVPIARDLAIMQTERIDRTPAREYAALLRAHFASASPQAQRVFRYALDRGPDPFFVSHVVAGDEMDDEMIRARVQEWQRKALRYFRGSVPPSLRDLEERLGPDPRAVEDAAYQRELDENGFAIRVRTGPLYGEQSPLEPDALLGMSPQAVFEFLLEWNPGRERTSEPSARGLANAVKSAVAADPRALEPLIASAAGAALRPEYLDGMLRGLRTAVTEGREIPWEAALDLGDIVFERLVTAASGDALLWGWASDAAIRLVEDGCSLDRFPRDLAERLWSSLERWHTPAAISPPNSSRFDDSPRSFIAEATNSRPGRVTRALLEAILWSCRNEAESSPRELRERLFRLLESVLAESGPGAHAVRIVIGRYIPHLWQMDRDRTLAIAERVFAPTPEPPHLRPGWIGYLQSRDVSDELFSDLRPWYREFLASVEPTDSAELQRAGNAEPLEAAARHVVGAVIRGILPPGDSLADALFTRAPVAVVGRAYWSLFREWTDAAQPVAGELQQGLLRLWSWRLDLLERDARSERAREEAAEMEWLVRIPHIPVDEVIPLARRTIALASRRGRVRPMWERVEEFSQVDPAAALEMASDLIDARLQGDYPDFPIHIVGPILQRGLASADETSRERARWLVHRLGEAGFTEFGALLTSSAPQPAERPGAGLHNQR
jgi:hypothetical protein